MPLKELVEKAATVYKKYKMGEREDLDKLAKVEDEEKLALAIDNLHNRGFGEAVTGTLGSVLTLSDSKITAHFIHILNEFVAFKQTKKRNTDLLKQVKKSINDYRLPKSYLSPASVTEAVTGAVASLLFRKIPPSLSKSPLEEAYDEFILQVEKELDAVMSKKWLYEEPSHTDLPEEEILCITRCACTETLLTEHFNQLPKLLVKDNEVDEVKDVPLCDAKLSEIYYALLPVLGTVLRREDKEAAKKVYDAATALEKLVTKYHGEYFTICAAQISAGSAAPMHQLHDRINKLSSNEGKIYHFLTSAKQVFKYWRLIQKAQPSPVTSRELSIYRANAKMLLGISMAQTPQKVVGLR